MQSKCRAFKTKVLLFWPKTSNVLDKLVCDRFRLYQKRCPPLFERPKVVQAARLIASPYDDEARFSKKRETTWTGNMVHLIETCDAEGPCITMHMETTLATTIANQMTAPIQAVLQAKDLLP
jgi:hypothetical protein